MPLYHHKCEKCGYEVEEMRSLVNFDNFPKCCGRDMPIVMHAVMSIMDIQPYRAIAADKETGDRPWITSRQQHREFLRKNNYEEIGNEPISTMKYEG